MKLLVRNLAVATTEEKLISLFAEHGKVQSCNLVVDTKTGKSKGFGFIEMPKAGEAKAAVKHLNGFKLAGSLIRVKKAETKKTEENTTPVAEKKATSVQFKQAAPAPKKTVVEPTKVTPNVVTKEVIKEETSSEEKVNPVDIWGSVKKPDEY